MYKSIIENFITDCIEGICEEIGNLIQREVFSLTYEIDLETLMIEITFSEDKKQYLSAIAKLKDVGEVTSSLYNEVTGYATATIEMQRCAEISY